MVSSSPPIDREPSSSQQRSSSADPASQHVRRYSLAGPHAQTHIRLASYGTSPAPSSISPFRSPSALAFVGNSSVVSDSPRHVRSYTAELAQLALDQSPSTSVSLGSMNVELPPPVSVPPISSVNSQSTLTKILRSSSDSSSPVSEVAVSPDSASDLPQSLSFRSTDSRRDSELSAYFRSSDQSLEESQYTYHITVSDDPLNAAEVDSIDEDVPLLTRSDSAENNDGSSRFSSEFSVQDWPLPRSRVAHASSWFGKAFSKTRKFLLSSTSSRFDDGHGGYSRPRIFQRAKPLFPSFVGLVQDCRDDILLPLKYIPSVILGLLLNVLDGLSYGMILFPIGEPIFSSLGPEGLSMFYVSCIISQLVYSSGGSVFKGGVGSEMIEVVPFFHSMAYTLLGRIGEDNRDSVIATTILAYAISSVITGIVFFALGSARIGSLIGFFPRHILVGCIGGVGWFLVATGIEVSSRMEGNLEYDFATARFLFEPMVFLKWFIPLLLAFVLLVLEHFVNHPLLVPSYFIIVFIAFHVLVSVISGISLPELRELGWVFVSPEANVPWYNFYKLYKFSAVDWPALFSTIPAMFALTFFGILHVPINVPALAVSVDVDNVDVDRELIAHGISNVLSGFAGSIQNYLVYTNSLLFIRSGADSRIAGFMLAFATTGIMIAGPGVIGVIPVMVVGALIFLLGIELLREALYDTWKRVNRVEYFVIVTIIVVMGTWDFVYGIIVGIILACGSFVVESSRKSAISATYSGAVARSTVRRHPFQQQFLKDVGHEIFVVKLTGFLFFGTIVSMESKIRSIIADAEHVHDEQYTRIKYLVLDFQGVSGIDFSAGEALSRIKRLLNTKRIDFIFCSVAPETAHSLAAIGLWNTSLSSQGASNETDLEHAVHAANNVFQDLNSALEWCENELLAVYYRVRELQTRALQGQTIAASSAGSEHAGSAEGGWRTSSAPRDIGSGFKSNLSNENDSLAEFVSPRQGFVQRVSSSAMLTDPTLRSELISPTEESSELPLGKGKENETDLRAKLDHDQPLTLWMQIIYTLSPYPADFWRPLSKYFVRERLEQGTILFHQGDTNSKAFYIVESGILKAENDYEQGHFTEAIVPGTTAGELPFFSETERTATMTVERDAIVWKLTRDAMAQFIVDSSKTDDPSERIRRQEILIELYKVAMKLTAERFSAVTSYVLTTAS
ncbi:sulfate transporter family-domain-containing protein [Lipomyces oligophaga]|uniref:sulfate transporter family-domain-containing protein n=1 Tax=Lipomyces oligophaga TaxID=45792 RepID=UPI0034CD32A2